MAKALATKYDPSEFEDKIYDFWQENKYFHAEPDETKKPYTIVIPPPNITGQLHMGHALDNTLQDILIRYHRMKGFDTLWVPGTDHASIATEAKIVEAMKQEGISKEDIGREAFLERAWDWRRQYGGRIVDSRNSVPPATGTGNGSPWTKAVPRPSSKSSTASMRRTSSTAASASSTGAPTA